MNSTKSSRHMVAYHLIDESDVSLNYPPERRSKIDLNQNGTSLLARAKKVFKVQHRSETEKLLEREQILNNLVECGMLTLDDEELFIFGILNMSSFWNGIMEAVEKFLNKADHVFRKFKVRLYRR